MIGYRQFDYHFKYSGY